MTTMFPALLALTLAALPAAAAAQGREAVVLTLPEAPNPALAAEIGASGVRIGELIADRDYLGSVPEGGLEAARAALPEGVGMEPLTPEQKLMTLDPDAARAADGASDGASDAEGDVDGIGVEIIPATGASDAAVAAVLDRLPVTVVDPNARQGWVLRLDPADLERLAREPIVESIYPAPATGTLR